MGAGIDWGNSNTVIAYRLGRQERLVDVAGEPCVPSYMHYTNEGELVAIGHQAKSALRTGELLDGQVVSGLKRLIGAAFDPDLKQWAQDVYGLNLRPGEQDRILVQVGQQWKSPEEMAREFFRMLLGLLQQDAHDQRSWFARLFSGAQMEACAVTCPVQYVDTQKAALQACLEQAGFQVEGRGLLPEPAAVIRMLPGKRSKNTLIIDWGGGTLDFAFVSAAGQCRGLTGVQANCGGIDMDFAIIKALSDGGQLPERMAPLDRAVAREFVEARKERVLSEDDPIPTETFQLPVSRVACQLAFQQNDVARWINPICTRAQNATDNTLQKYDDVNVERCVLVGGPFCSDYVRAKICEVLDKDCEVILPEGSPMTAVAIGACRAFAEEHGATGLLVHDYGVMVDLLNHTQGLVMLRGEQTYPVASPARSFRLRGAAGRGIEVTVFARKTNPATETQTYETSSTFHFLPRFQDGQALIHVLLEADASGVINAKVTDEATQREMRLDRVGQGISRPMRAPPARSSSEEPGLWLLQCWQELQLMTGLTTLLTGPDAGAVNGNVPGQIEQNVNAWIKLHWPPENIEALWERVESLGRELVARAEQLSQRQPGLDHTLNDVRSRIQATRGTALEQSPVRELLHMLDDLLLYLVRGFGDEVASMRRATEAQAKDGTINKGLDALLHLVAGFQGSLAEYEKLVALTSEVQNELERECRQANAMGTLARIQALVGKSHTPYSRLQELWSDFGRICGRSE